MNPATAPATTPVRRPYPIAWGAAGVLALTALLGALTWARWPDIDVDCGREAYVPARLAGLLGGQHAVLLYRDLQFQFGPLTPYFHALLFRIFGLHLTVLYVIGLLVTAGIGLLSFRIAARMFSETGAALCAGLIVAAFAFRPSLMNYVFPYTFAASYGLLLLGGVLWLIVRRFDLAAGGLTAGELRAIGWLTALAVLNKQEFGAATVVAVGLLFVVHPEALGEHTRGQAFRLMALPLLLLPALVYGFFFWRVGVHQLLEENLLATHIVRAQKAFYEQLGRPHSFRVLYFHTWWRLGRWYAPSLAWMAGVVHGLRLLERRLRRRVSTWAVMLLLLSLPVFLLLQALADTSYDWKIADFYNWILSVAILIWLVAIRRTRAWSPREKTVFLLLATGLVLLLRVLNTPALTFYPNLLVWPSALVYFYLLFRVLPDWVSGWDDRFTPLLRGASLALLGMVVGLYAQTSLESREWRFYRVHGAVGTIYSDGPRGQVFQQTADALRHDGGNSLLVLPEDAFLYLFVNQVSPLPYTHFVPGHVSGPHHEQAAIAVLDRHPPDHVVVVERDVVVYFTFAPGAVARYFGTDYNQALMAWVRNHYVLEHHFVTSTHWADIYRRRDDAPVAPPVVGGHPG
ncbi:MAG: hypothetical protein ACYC6M_00885 [Terriglobales bacterium]